MTKRCGWCREEKPLTEFNRCAVIKGGYRPECRYCRKIRRVALEEGAEPVAPYTFVRQE